MKQIWFKLSFLIIISLLFSTLETRFFDYNNCIFHFDDNGINVTYNLTLLHINGGVFQVDDYDYLSNFRYEFQICGHISRTYWNTSIPSYCKNVSTNYETKGRPCLNISNSNCSAYYNISQQRASAVQINEFTHVCRWLGTEISESYSKEYNLTNYTVSLYDSSNGAAGIIYTIENGEFCATGQPPRYNRQLTVELICPDSAKQYFSPQIEASKILNETVIEHPQCAYTLSITTPLACPAQCIDVNITGGNKYSVCNGKGLCVTDPIAGSVKCLCDDGWTGDTCNQVESTIVIIQHSQSSLLTVIIICIVLLTIALGLVLILCYQIRKREENIRDKQKDYIQPLTNEDVAVNIDHDHDHDYDHDHDHDHDHLCGEWHEILPTTPHHPLTINPK